MAKTNGLQRGEGGFTFVDLFAGIGGFHLGLSSVGGKCVYANEWDAAASKTYEAWTGHKPDQRDIRKISFKSDIPSHDVLAAGFPCQPFSLAGVSKKASLGRAHGFQDLDQGNLFFSICDIVAAHRPKIVFLENVKNLTSHDKGKTWAVIQSSLEELGYHVLWKVIDAKYWVPQHRERIFIVALSEHYWSVLDAGQFNFPEPPRQPLPKLKGILDKKPSKDLMLTEPLWTYLQDYSEKHRKLGNGFGFSLASQNSVSRTLSARYFKDGSEILIRHRAWERPRKLSVNEARRLMGFSRQISLEAGLSGRYPQVVSNSQAYKQFGNSVSPLVVRSIGAEISRLLADLPN